MPAAIIEREREKTREKAVCSIYADRYIVTVAMYSAAFGKKSVLKE